MRHVEIFRERLAVGHPTGHPKPKASNNFFDSQSFGKIGHFKLI